MTWLAWRQFRANAVLAAVALVAVIAVLVATQPEVAGIADVNALSGSLRSLRLLGTALIAVPALIGAFWGAPLVAHELETGTHRMIWTQSVTRPRWFASRLGIALLWAVGVTGAFSLVFTWWSQPFDQLGNRIGTANFGQRGVAPIAYAVFALALGALAGAVLRRTLPAMAATLAGFLVVRFAFQRWVRTHLLDTVQARVPSTYFGTPVGRSTHGTGGWILSTTTVDGHGRGLSAAQIETLVRDSCTVNRTTTANALARCADNVGLHDVVTMHPASQFWTLQALESLCFLCFAAVLIAACVWWIRTRLV